MRTATISGRIVEATLDDVELKALGGRSRRRTRASTTRTRWRRPARARSCGGFRSIGGIDVAGTVESSGDPRFKAGDPVLVTGYDLGVAHDGGYAAVRARAGRLGRAAAAGAVGVRGDGDRHRRLHRGAVDRRDGAQRPDAADTAR